MIPLTEDRLDSLRQSPRQADVTDVEDLCSEIDRLRIALVRIANVEERPALIASQTLGLVQNDGQKRAYYETHDPPHCPTCGCGLPSPDTCSCGRVELKDGYVRATCADGSVHTKGGCNPTTEGAS